MESIVLGLLIIIVVLVWAGVKIVPQQSVWIIERMGKYDRTLEPGLSFITPFIERVAYRHTLKECAIDILEQTAITKDNVTLVLGGIIYVRVIAPIDASYGVEDPYYAVTQLAQTSMRSAIGKLTMDKSFEERELLSAQIVSNINEAATTWGIQCMRYEIKDIKPPVNVLKAMETQVAAERQKRADILASEGKMQSAINLAEAKKQEIVLNSEAVKIDQENRAQGEATAIKLIAEATANDIKQVSDVIEKETNAMEAVSYRVAQQYVEAFKMLAKETNTIVVPANAGDAGAMIAQSLAIFNNINKKA